ncbi:MAG: DUF4145 domain-containing protein [Nitrospira sp.]
MKLDPLISQRFKELTAKAKAVSKSRKASGPGSDLFGVSSPLFQEWAANALSLLDKSFGRESIHFTTLSDHVKRFVGWEKQFEECRSIFKAAREDYEGGYLFSVRALVKAEVLADAFSQVRSLLASNYNDPSCILCRVALEVALKELCDRKAIPQGNLEKMNTELCKVGVYNMAKQKQITAWADIGNKAAHGQWDQYTQNDAQSMLDGVQALVADIL